MKKFIYIFGIVLLNIFAFGAIFKILHWPGAGILLSCGLGLFALLFLPLAFNNNYRGAGKKNLSLYVSGFVCALICVIGALFKIQHWPGAAWFLIIGVPLPFLYFLPVYLYHQRKDKNKSVINFLGVMFLLLYISVFSALLALSVSKNIIDSMVVSAEDNAKTTQLFTAKNKLLYSSSDTMAIGDNKKLATQLKAKTDSLCSKISAIKRELIFSAGNADKTVFRGNIIDYRAIEKLDEAGTTELIMRGNDGVSGRALELKKMIQEYQAFLEGLFKYDYSYTNQTAVLLNTKDVSNTDTENNTPVSWEDSFFQHGNYLIVALGKLECIETNVKMAENEALQTLIR